MTPARPRPAGPPEWWLRKHLEYARRLATTHPHLRAANEKRIREREEKRQRT